MVEGLAAEGGLLAGEGSFQVFLLLSGGKEGKEGAGRAGLDQDSIESGPDSRPAAGHHLIGWQLAGPITAARPKTEMTTPFQASYCSDTQSVNQSINQSNIGIMFYY